MLVSMTPNDEVKTIHASLNDGKLRKWEFEPYTEQGKIELTDQDYATIQSIKGNTVKFNQLVPINTQASATINGITFTNNNDGSIAANGTASANAGFSSGEWSPSSDFSKDLKTRGGHKILVIPNSKNYSGYDVSLRAQGFITDGVSVPVNEPTIFQLASNISTFNTVQIYPLVLSGKTATNFYCKPNIIDFTQIFGSGNEPATVEAFETWLSNNIGLLPYYDYTLGSLISFNGTGLKTTGKNLLTLDIATLKTLNNSGTWNGNSYTVNGVTFDVQTNSDGQITGILVNGTNTGTGTAYFIYQNSNNMNTPFAQNILGKNIILSGCPQRSGNPYIQMFNTWGTTIPIYDNGTDTAQLNVPSQINGYRCQIEVYANQTLSNVLFKPMLRLANISDNTFEPYTENTLSLPISTLFPTGMKLAGTVYDEISDKAYTRIGEVDLGSLEYTMDATNRFTAILPGLAIHTYNARQADGMKSSLYIPSSTSSDNLTIFKYSATGWSDPRIYMYNTSYTDAATFKQAMADQNVKLYYELATPTSQDISIDLTYPVWNNGTEQILPVNGSTPTTSPMVATIEYPDRTEDVDFLYKQTTFESNIPQFSLVCKNQELPMTLNDDKLICECDSSITNESGFFDCKVKMQDLESVAYSQKIQLHVERGIND